VILNPQGRVSNRADSGETGETLVVLVVDR
jgi:hypothetical protein